LSVPLNIAEASGRTGSGDNARHFSIARGSALESGAIIDAAYTLKLLDEQKYADAKMLIVAIVAMLSKLCTKK
jgi:four helix bundle protein